MAQKIDLPDEYLIREYRNGRSLRSLAEEFDVDKRTIERHIYGPHTIVRPAHRPAVVCPLCGQTGYCHHKHQFYTHGLSTEEAATVWESQGGCCAGCGKELDPSNRNSIHFDHDHSRNCGRFWSCSGCFRGILCHTCNNLLGFAHDSPAELRRRVAGLRRYLTEWRRD